MTGISYMMTPLETVLFMSFHALLIVVLMYFSSIKNSKIILIVAIIIAALPIAFRFNMGSDTAEYAKWVIILGEKGDFIQAQKWSNHEPSFIILSLISYSLTKSYRLVFVFYAVFTTGFIFSALWKMRKQINPVVSVLFYIVFFQWSTCVNTMRQALAIAIVFYGITLIYEKKFIKYILIVLLASTFHKSAIWALILYPYCIKNSRVGEIFRSFKLWGPPILIFAPSLIINLVKLISTRYEGYQLGQKFGLGWVPTVTLFVIYISEYKKNSEEFKNQNFIFKELYVLATIFIITDYTAGEVSRMRDYMRVYEMYAIGSIIKPGIYSQLRKFQMTKSNFVIVGYYILFWMMNMFNTLINGSCYYFSMSLFN